MTSEPCESFRDRLVDRADGELPAAEAQRVLAHLAGCASCRAELRRLERSLELARAVWREAAEAALVAAQGSDAPSGIASTTAPGTVPFFVEEHSVSPSDIADEKGDCPPRPARPRKRATYPAVAAAALAGCAVVLLVGALWLAVQPTAQRVATEDPGRGATANDPSQAEELDVASYIAREGRSARLAVAVQFLAAQPGLEPYQKQAERYLADAYGGTTAVGPTPPPPPPPVKEPQS